MKSFRHLFNLGVVFVMALIVITALGYDRQTRLLPLIVSVPVLILAIAQTIQDFRASKEKTKKKKEEAGEEEEKKGLFAKEIIVSFWTVAMFISLYLFGFIATTFLYTFLWLKFHARYSWLSSLSVSGGSLAFLYIVLIYALNVQLYDGVVIIALRKAILGY